jgi:thioesterase domain-containing protein
MAQQLIAQGEQVAFLALMDCYNPAFGKMISRPRYAYCHARFFAKRVIGVARRVAASPKKELPSRLKLVLRGSSSLPMNSQGTTSPRRRIAASDRATSNLQRVHDANLRAGERYVPGPYPGKITIFRAADPIKEPYQDEFLGWRIVARGGIVVEVIPGHHAAFDRRVHGEILDRHLREAQQEPRRYTA